MKKSSTITTVVNENQNIRHLTSSQTVTNLENGQALGNDGENTTLILRPLNSNPETHIWGPGRSLTGNNVNDTHQTLNPSTNDHNWGVGHQLGSIPTPDLNINADSIHTLNNTELYNHFMRYLPINNIPLNNIPFEINNIPIDPNSNNVRNLIMDNPFTFNHTLPRHLHLNMQQLGRLRDITTEYVFSNSRYVYTRIPNIPDRHLFPEPLDPINNRILHNIQNLFTNIFNNRFELRNLNLSQIPQSLNDLFSTYFHGISMNELITQLTIFIQTHNRSFSLPFLFAFIYVLFRQRSEFMPMFRELINNVTVLQHLIIWLSIFSLDIIYSSSNIIITSENFDVFLVLTQEQLNRFLYNIGIMADELDIIFNAAERSNNLILIEEAAINERIIERQNLINTPSVNSWLNRNRLLIGGTFLGVTAIGLYWFFRRSSSSSQTTPNIIISTLPTQNINVTPHVTVTGSTTGWDLLVRLLNHISR